MVCLVAHIICFRNNCVPIDAPNDQNQPPSRLFCFEITDGQKFKISVPKGPIGGKVKDLNDNLTPLVDFQPIPTNVPQVPSHIFKEACNRQRFHELLISISNGRGSVHPKFEKNSSRSKEISRKNTNS